jgi:hypothetical protein
VTWNWWINSDAGLAARVAVGVAVLAALAAWDLHRHGRQATRWREYLFLVACVAVALVYGALNDQVTTTVSWEYFAYGKGVAEALPPGEPPNSAAFRWEAAKVGMRATWSAGLIVGVALLIANNPRRDGRPRLSYARLFGCLPLVFGVVIVAVICLGDALAVGSARTSGARAGSWPSSACTSAATPAAWSAPSSPSSASTGRDAAPPKRRRTNPSPRGRVTSVTRSGDPVQ